MVWLHKFKLTLRLTVWQESDFCPFWRWRFTETFLSYFTAVELGGASCVTCYIGRHFWHLHSSTGAHCFSLVSGPAYSWLCVRKSTLLVRGGETDPVWKQVGLQTFSESWLVKEQGPKDNTEDESWERETSPWEAQWESRKVREGIQNCKLR